MKDITHHRKELDRLGQELFAAWREKPYPVDKIALLNKKLREAIDASGFVEAARIVPTLEEREKSRAYSRNYYLTKRKRKPVEVTTNA